jgi:hypothetical protein
VRSHRRRYAHSTSRIGFLPDGIGSGGGGRPLRHPDGDNRARGRRRQSNARAVLGGAQCIGAVRDIPLAMLVERNGFNGSNIGRLVLTDTAFRRARCDDEL